MSDLHRIFAAALAPHLNAQAAIDAATVYRPAANRMREYKTAAEAQTYDLAAECWPANLVDVRPELMRAATDAWHDMERRAQMREDERADEVAALRERGLL